jgi:acyl CoA:acetate/3-ketoacid CoA transferase alpha subunit
MHIETRFAPGDRVVWDGEDKEMFQGEVTVVEPMVTKDYMEVYYWVMDQNGTTHHVLDRRLYRAEFQLELARQWEAVLASF